MVIFVANVVLYIMAKQNVALAKENVELCDVASIYCEDETIRAKAETLKIHRFRQDSAPRVVVSILKIIEQLTKLCPGITVESIGETDIIIEKASLQHDKPQQKKSPWAYIKIAFVALICFFGSGFTIMAFHNDVGVPNVLNNIYQLVMGVESDGCTALEEVGVKYFSTGCDPQVVLPDGTGNDTLCYHGPISPDLFMNS